MPKAIDGKELVRAFTEALNAANAEGLDAEAAATFVGVSRTAYYSLDRRGLVPSSVTVGDGPRRWLRSELMAWMRAGCPSRLAWRGQREQAMRRVG